MMVASSSSVRSAAGHSAWLRMRRTRSVPSSSNVVPKIIHPEPAGLTERVDALDPHRVMPFRVDRPVGGHRRNHGRTSSSRTVHGAPRSGSGCPVPCRSGSGHGSRRRPPRTGSVPAGRCARRRGTRCDIRYRWRRAHRGEQRVGGNVQVDRGGEQGALERQAERAVGVGFETEHGQRPGSFRSRSRRTRRRTGCRRSRRLSRRNTDHDRRPVSVGVSHSGTHSNPATCEARPPASRCRYSSIRKPASGHTRSGAGRPDTTASMK